LNGRLFDIYRLIKYKRLRTNLQLRLSCVIICKGVYFYAFLINALIRRDAR